MPPERLGDAGEVPLQTDLIQALMDAVPIGVCLVDQKLRIRHVNDAAKKLFGSRSRLAIGRPIGAVLREAWPEQESSQMEALILEALWADTPREWRTPIAGHALVLQLNRIQIRDNDNRTMGVLITDKTGTSAAEEALRESESNYRELVSQVKDYAIFRMDLNGRALTWNEGVERVLGFAEEEFVGRNITSEIFTPEAIAEGVPARELRIAREKGAANDDRWMRRKNGERFFALGMTTAIKNQENEVIGFSKLMRDHTDLIEAQAALRESEERYRMLAELCPDAILVNQSGYFVYANAAAARLLGAPSAEHLIGHSPGDFMSPQDAALVRERVRQMIEEGNDSPLAEYRSRRLDGTWVDIEVSATTTNWNALPAVLVLARDVSQRKAAEAALRESEERFRNLTDAAPAMIWVTDESDQCTFFSRSWYEYTGQRAEEGLGSGWVQALHPEDRESTIQAFRAASADREPFAYDYRIRTRDGDYRWASSAARPHFDEGRFVGYVGSVIDRHERKLAEDALAKSHDELEARVAERTRELQYRAEQLARLASELSLTEQRERQRLAQILHDHIQQLLVGVRMRLDMLLREKGERSEERVTEIIALMDEAISESRTLTIELAPPILREAGLAAGVRWLARWMEEKHHLSVFVEADEESELEREDVRILLFDSIRELLFNVVKHSGTKEAGVQVRATNGGCVKVIVWDEGKGFESGKVLASTPSEPRGFGLFTIRERIALLGGQLEIESEPGRGAKFTILAPAYEGQTVDQCETSKDGAEASHPAPPQQERKRREGPIRVLVVDDHKVMRESLASLLSSEPELEVVGQAGDAAKAMELRRALDPEVVLMDYSLPGTDGAEITRRMKSESPNIFVIGFSMYDDQEQAQAMIRAGASAYLSKSRDTGGLIDVIRNVTERMRS